MITFKSVQAVAESHTKRKLLENDENEGEVLKRTPKFRTAAHHLKVTDYTQELCNSQFLNSWQLMFSEIIYGMLQQMRLCREMHTISSTFSCWGEPKILSGLFSIDEPQPQPQPPCQPHSKPNEYQIHYAADEFMDAAAFMLEFAE